MSSSKSSQKAIDRAFNQGPAKPAQCHSSTQEGNRRHSYYPGWTEKPEVYRIGEAKRKARGFYRPRANDDADSYTRQLLRRNAAALSRLGY